MVKSMRFSLASEMIIANEKIVNAKVDYLKRLVAECVQANDIVSASAGGLDLTPFDPARSEGRGGSCTPCDMASELVPLNGLTGKAT